VRVIHADMRRLSLPEPVDLVLCEFNPLNHLAQRSDLVPAFRRVAGALRPGGWFYFDLNMWPSYKHYSREAHWMEGPGFCLTMRGGFDRRRRRAWAICEWFVRSGRSWRRYRERLDDSWWTHAEIRSALLRAGFTGIRSWDGARVRPRSIHPRPGFDRYYLAQKGS
jgi:SAM-dependent methyltransferase